MGYFGHWLVVRGAQSSALRRLGLQPARDEAAPGWRYAFGKGFPSEFDTLLQRAARAGDGAAVGAWIFDSDFGQVVGVADGRRAAVAIGADAADEPLEHDPWGFSTWSTCAPHPLTVAEVDAIVTSSEVLAEETVDELLDRLGLRAPYDPRREQDEPSAAVTITVGDAARERRSPATRETVGAIHFGGYVEPLGSMHDTAYVDPAYVPWRELRHVPGLGDGFLGIWDREAPEAPIATFPVSRRGEARLEEELERLQVPVRVEALRADELGGCVAPAGILSGIRIAVRDLSLRDARFVLGRGDGFIGVWDRTYPSAPLQRFPANAAGEEAAYRHAYALLFEEELAAKETPGVRLYLPRRQPELVREEVGEPPPGLPRELRDAWETFAEQGAYTPSGGTPWLIVEEEPDERWRVVASPGHGGRFHIYSVGTPGGEELMCRGAFETLEHAREYAARVEHAQDEWEPVPVHVPRTLLATLRWAQSELGGRSEGRWYERFDWVDPSVRVGGARSFARVFERGVPVAAVVAAAHDHGGEANAYLLRPRDAARFVYSLDRLDYLLAMLGNYLGDVELGEWRALPDEWPDDLAALGPAVLVLAGAL